MKIYITCLILLCSLSLVAQNDNPNYDAALASKLQADDYGMKSYVLVILKTGTNETVNKSFRDSCFAGHFSNMNKMKAENKLIVAGPIGKNEMAYRGIFILNVATIEEAKDLIKNDPAIDSKILIAELYEWYGSAALPEYLNASDKVWKLKP